MNKEHCYGIIPIRGKSVFLVQHRAGHWGFPKGHPNTGETALETAQRELLEETGLVVVRLINEKPLEEHYTLTREGKKVHKTVTYYIAEVEGKPALQTEELKAGKWVELENASDVITFDEARKICKAVVHLLA